MKEIKTVDAVGKVIGHDITEIVPGVRKGRAFKKGHIIKEEDVEKLLDIGKYHIYVLELEEDELHEDDAAKVLGRVGMGEGLEVSKEIKEGKISFYAKEDGVLKVDKERLFKLNMKGQISFATLPSNVTVKKGELVGGARVIPLVISKKKMEDIEKEFNEKPLLEVKKIYNYKVGVVSTGTELYEGRIKDKFGPVIKSKVENFGSVVIGQKLVPDDMERIKEAGRSLLSEGADMLIFTGGMSVDPDDLTPTAIKALGGELISYGSPVLPGSMFLLSYLDGVPVMGLPGCVMYSKKTVFDLVLPRIMSKEKLKVEDIMEYGHGGLCQLCDVCTYPNCSFGKS